MKRYQVDVSNVGTVFTGELLSDAEREFKECKQLSESGYGRFAGESVTLLCDGEPIKEHFGKNDN